MTEDMTFTARQAVRHVCVALKKYFEAHLGIKADEIRRDQNNEFSALASDTSAVKVISLQPLVCAKLLSGCSILQLNIWSKRHKTAL